MNTPPGHEADGSGQPGSVAQGFGHLDSRRQQRPEAGRDHHPGGKAEQSVEEPLVDLAVHEHQAGAGSGHGPGEQGGQQGQENRVDMLQKSKHEEASRGWMSGKSVCGGKIVRRP
jgi:hypothetical protein